MQREFNADWIEVVGFTALEMETAAKPRTPHLPLARVGDAAHATPMSQLMYILSVDAANNGLQFLSCTYNAGHVGMQ